MRFRKFRPSVILCLDTSRAPGWDLAHPKTSGPNSSTSSTGRSTLASPIPRSRRGLPTWVATCSRSRPPTLASSSPTKPKSGARSSGPSTSRRTEADPLSIFHNLPIGEIADTHAMLALSLSALWSGQTVTADTLARNIESAGDSRTVIRCLLIVSASERQQIAALATQEFLLAPIRRIRLDCCACAASGHAATAPPSAASNSRRRRVTVIRPSRARVLKRDDTTPPAYSPRPAPGTLHLKIIKISLGLSAVLSAADFLAPGGLMPGEIGRPLERPASLALDVPRL